MLMMRVSGVVVVDVIVGGVRWSGAVETMMCCSFRLRIGRRRGRVL